MRSLCNTCRELFAYAGDGDIAAHFNVKLVGEEAWCGGLNESRKDSFDGG